MNRFVCVLIALTGALPACAVPLGAFSYPDTASAREHWTPQFGSLPVRVEMLPDGSTCLAFDAEFTREGDRACWDWSAPLDLSTSEAIACETCADNGGLARSIGVYFGTPNGWYGSFSWSGFPDTWSPRTLALGDCGTEGTPDGWDKVTTFRFSVWSTGPGKATFRLRNLRTVPADAARNLIPNGSFECPGSEIPYGWGSGHWGVGDLPWAADMDLWRRHWGLDHTVSHDGRSSLRLRNTPGLPLLRAVSAWVTPPVGAKICVFSAWLRSDRSGLPVVLQCGERSTTVTVGKGWQQAALTGITRGELMALVVAPQAPGTLWVDAVQLQAGDQPTADYHPAMGDEALAFREARVDWTPPRRAPWVAAGRTTAGPLAPARVSIDDQGRYLLNGKPYLQHSLGLEFISDLAILDFTARAGFRDVCVEINAALTTERLREIADRCAQVGLRLIPWLDGNIPHERFTAHIQALRGHPALLCWYVFDEPSGSGFEEAEARLALARQLDPSVPAFINYLGDKLTEQRGDLYSTDVYPIPHGAPTGAIWAVQTMAGAAEAERKPVWMWLQGTGYAYWMAREPTPRELSCMAYGSLIAGARGLYYFAQVPRSRGCFDEMRALCVETEALTPVLASQGRAVACDAPAIMARAFRHRGQTWVVTVNTGGAPVNASFDLTGVVGAGEVYFEDRAVEAHRGQWSDDFGPYERHVYRFGSGH